MEIVTPYKSEDGITFYISNDGKQTGISIVGLERLLGLDPRSCLFTKSQNKLLWRMSIGDDPLETDPECLKPLWGKVFEPTAVGSDGARIVRSQTMVAIIEYYAFDRNNPVAKHSFRAFANIGVDNWIKQTVNYTVDEKQNEMLNMLRQLHQDMQIVKTKVEKLERLDGITVTLYPGAKHINDGLSSTNQLMLMDDRLYSAKDWLASKGVKLTHGGYISFGHLVAQTYKTLTGKNPQVKYKTSPRKNKPGKTVKAKEGWGYRNIDFYIMEAAYEKFKKKMLWKIEE
jgi:hypothetical protein